MLPSGVRGKAPAAKSFGAFWVLPLSSPAVLMIRKTVCIYFRRTMIYVAAKATYIRLLHGKIDFLGGFFSALAP